MTTSEFRQTAATLLNSPTQHTRLCADFINAFWRARGFDAEARADGVDIVSNLRNGVPTKRLAQ